LTFINDFLQSHGFAIDELCVTKTKNMFTLEQIRQAHSSVKTGADFPAYIQEMKLLGIRSYEHFVADGHIIYKGHADFTLTAPAKWESVPVALHAQEEKLRHDIKIHQAGLTDYPTFCRQSADSGVKKWVVDMQKMMCTYYDLSGREMVAEPIPEANVYTH
jgi:uncharacterized protein YbcV (DUF1398 family)